MITGEIKDKVERTDGRKYTKQNVERVDANTKGILIG
jgi:hypothetical protein